MLVLKFIWIWLIEKCMHLCFVLKHLNWCFLALHNKRTFLGKTTELICVKWKDESVLVQTSSCCTSLELSWLLLNFNLWLLGPAGDENLPYVSHGEHQCREQTEGGWEAGGKADRTSWRSRLSHPPRGKTPETELCEEDWEDEGEGK